jgi:hypothetical protein
MYKINGSEWSSSICFFFLSPKNCILASTGYEVVWIPEPVWMWRKWADNDNVNNNGPRSPSWFWLWYPLLSEFSAFATGAFVDIDQILYSIDVIYFPLGNAVGCSCMENCCWSVIRHFANCDKTTRTSGGHLRNITSPPRYVLPALYENSFHSCSWQLHIPWRTQCVYTHFFLLPRRHGPLFLRTSYEIDCDDVM